MSALRENESLVFRSEWTTWTKSIRIGLAILLGCSVLLERPACIDAIIEGTYHYGPGPPRGDRSEIEPKVEGSRDVELHLVHLAIEKKEKLTFL